MSYFYLKWTGKQKQEFWLPASELQQVQRDLKLKLDEDRDGEVT